MLVLFFIFKLITKTNNNNNNIYITIIIIDDAFSTETGLELGGIAGPVR